MLVLNKMHSKTTNKSKYKYTYYQNTDTLQNPHIHTPTHYKTIESKCSTRYIPNEIVTIQSSTLSIRSL